MSKSEMKKRFKHLRYYYVGVLLFITIIISVFVVFEIKTAKEHIEELAIIEAKSNFDKDVSFRNWIATHGGAYVPISKTTPPNPNLSHIAERDIITPSGKKLTLLNPAYMMRQLNEYFYDSYGKYGNITSLKLLRAANKPDEWEEKALHQFEDGVKSILEFTDYYGVPYIRYMEPLITEEGCLKCHAHQGYKVGDIRGGIGVKIPITKYWKLGVEQRDKIITSFIIVWGIIILLITFGYIKLKYYLLELEATEKELIFMKKNIIK